MKIYRYPPRALSGDYLRAATGVAVGGGVLLSVPESPAIIVIFGGLAGLFSFFGYRTVERHVTKMAVTDQEICSSGFGSRVMAWSDLTKVKLRYYGTKRQDPTTGGFMQLTLKGGGTSVTCDSSMEGFDEVARRAALAARDNGLALDDNSIGNLLALGFDVDREAPPPEA
ncbi:MAG: hypothetical protein AAF495_18985 [Pseudomonadota bacterium]